MQTQLKGIAPSEADLVDMALAVVRKIMAAIKNGLKQGYYSTGTLHGLKGKNKHILGEKNITDPNMECQEWDIVDNASAETIVAKCDGYDGVEQLISSDDLRNLLGYTAEEWEETATEWGAGNPFWERTTVKLEWLSLQMIGRM